MRLVKHSLVSYSIIIMLTKLGYYLGQQSIRKPVRYITSSGEEFVVMPAKDYALLTGLDTAILPVAEVSDTVTSVRGEDRGNFSALAHLQLEDEIRVDNLPL